VLDEAQIARSAAVILRQFGDDADHYLRLRVERRQDAGDPDGAAVWKAIADAVRSLRNASKS